MTLPTTYEPYAVNQFADILPFVDFRPQWLIDCGPGFGVEAHKFKERWPEIRILGLEPNRQTFARIVDEYPGMLLDVAAWDENGIARIHQTESEMGASLVHPGDPKRPGKKSVDVWTFTLDVLDHMHGPFSDAVLWADVEGSELRILEGSARLLARGAIRLMNLEVHEGHEEAEMDTVCMTLGFRPVLRYAGNGLHHDVVYRLQEGDE